MTDPNQIPNDPKARWHKADGLLRNLKETCPEWAWEYFDIFWYATAKTPRDRLKININKRLQAYKHSKRIAACKGDWLEDW